MSQKMPIERNSYKKKDPQTVACLDHLLLGMDRGAAPSSSDFSLTRHLLSPAALKFDSFLIARQLEELNARKMGDFSEILLSTETILKKCVPVLVLPVASCPCGLHRPLLSKVSILGPRSHSKRASGDQNLTQFNRTEILTHSPLFTTFPRYGHYEEDLERKKSKRKKSGDPFTDKYFEIHERCQDVQLRGAANNAEKNRALRAALNAELYVTYPTNTNRSPRAVLRLILPPSSHSLFGAYHTQPERKGRPTGRSQRPL